MKAKKLEDSDDVCGGRASSHSYCDYTVDYTMDSFFFRIQILVSVFGRKLVLKTAMMKSQCYQLAQGHLNTLGQGQISD